ncbi:Cholinephosphotransferase [Entamoeba marina]
MSIFGLVYIIACLILNYTGILEKYEYVAVGMLVLFYHLNDKMDGIQARTTKMCNGLGEFIDHGVDALVVGWMCFIISNQCGMTQHETTLLIVFGYTAFFFHHVQTSYQTSLQYSYIFNQTTLVFIHLILQCVRTFLNITTSQIQQTSFGGIRVNTIIILCTITTTKTNSNKGLFRVIYPFIIVVFTSYLLLSSPTNSSIIHHINIHTTILFLSHFVQLYIAHSILSIRAPDFGYIQILMLTISVILYSTIWNYDLKSGKLTGVDVYWGVIIVFVTHLFSIVYECVLVSNVVTLFSTTLKLKPFAF